MSTALHQRLADQQLKEALAWSPVVTILGPRQCGKTTLAQSLAPQRAYRSFDDPNELSAAQHDPLGYARNLPDSVTLDEIQKVPELMPVLKLLVDTDRRPGRFLLTGSANLLLLPRLSESLAGRMETLRLEPLSQAEMESRPGRFLANLLAGRLPAQSRPPLGDELLTRLVKGGYPAVIGRNDAGRQRWHRSYLDALVQRDVRDLIDLQHTQALGQLLGLIAQRLGNLWNAADLAGPLGLSRPTVVTYTEVLERLFILEKLPAWHQNPATRLIKAPKLHCVDSGLAATLIGLKADAGRRPEFGPLLEGFVYGELRRLAAAGDDEVKFYHYRDKDGVEVDLVLETPDRRLWGIEVKAAASIHPSDFKGLRRLADLAGDRFQGGLLLHDGERTLPFGDKLWALPLSSLWNEG